MAKRQKNDALPVRWRRESPDLAGSYTKKSQLVSLIRKGERAWFLSITTNIDLGDRIGWFVQVHHDIWTIPMHSYSPRLHSIIWIPKRDINWQIYYANLRDFIVYGLNVIHQSWHAPKNCHISSIPPWYITTQMLDREESLMATLTQEGPWFFCLSFNETYRHTGIRSNTLENALM